MHGNFDKYMNRSMNYSMHINLILLFNYISINIIII